MTRPSLALALLSTLLVTGSAQATTYTTTDYAVTIAGTASYNRADVDDEASAQHDLDVSFRSEIPRLTFHGDAAEDSRDARTTAAVTRGSYVITGPSAQLRCTSHELGDVTGGGLDATRGAEGTTFATRVLGAVTVDVSGCHEVMRPWQFFMGSGSDPVGVGIFDGSFVLPHSQIGAGLLEFPLQGEVTGSSCPFHHAKTALCSLTWEATVRFVKTGTGTGPGDDEDLHVPLDPAPAPTPAPVPQPPVSTPVSPPPPPAAQDDDLLVPLKPVEARAQLADDLSRASLPLACATACHGTVTATAGGRTLARVPFRAASGRTAVARLRFDAADRRAIRRAGGRVRLAVRARAGGRTVRTSTTLRRR